MNKNFLITISILFILAILGTILIFRLYIPQDQNTQPTIQVKPTVQKNKAYSLTEIGKHDFDGDCWLIINNNVYNVTAYISSHPGGTAILENCGKDATELFNAKPHSQNAKNLLETYLVGQLEQAK